MLAASFSSAWQRVGHSKQVMGARLLSVAGFRLPVFISLDAFRRAVSELLTASARGRFHQTDAVWFLNIWLFGKFG